MNHEEIEVCVLRAKTGNQIDLLKVLEQYKPFIIKMAAQFNIRNYDNYDLLQIGYIALINSVTKYKTGLHTFSSYAYNSIKNAFRYTARNNLKFSEYLSLNIPMNPESSINTEFINCIQGEVNLEEDLINAEKIKELKSALSSLTEGEMELVIMVYYGKSTLKTYAEKKCIDYYEAYKSKNRILKKLGRYIKR